jgi:hypothetical protein
MSLKRNQLNAVREFRESWERHPGKTAFAFPHGSGWRARFTEGRENAYADADTEGEAYFDAMARYQSKAIQGDWKP